MSILHRGNLLWEGSRMFLPEHREQLLKQRKKQTEFIPPQLDENHLEQMNLILQEALQEDRAVIVTYAGRYTPEQFCGFIDRVDPYTQSILIIDGECQKHLSLEQILDIQWA